MQKAEKAAGQLRRLRSRVPVADRTGTALLLPCCCLAAALLPVAALLLLSCFPIVALLLRCYDPVAVLLQLKLLQMCGRFLFFYSSTFLFAAFHFIT